MKGLILGFSALTERIYLGRVSKRNHSQWRGEKLDITSNFIQVMLQKFKPGYETTVDVDGKPKYTVTVKEIKKARKQNEGEK